MRRPQHRRQGLGLWLQASQEEHHPGCSQRQECRRQVLDQGLLLQAAGQGQDEPADRSWGRKQDVDDWPHASQERTAVQGLWQLQHAEKEAEGSRTGRRRHELVSRADADGILNQVTRVQDSLMPAF